MLEDYNSQHYSTMGVQTEISLKNGSYKEDITASIVLHYAICFRMRVLGMIVVEKVPNIGCGANVIVPVVPGLSLAYQLTLHLSHNYSRSVNQRVLM